MQKNIFEFQIPSRAVQNYFQK